jgi:hypothetical protein
VNPTAADDKSGATTGTASADTPAIDFKGIVSIAAIDGSTIKVNEEESKSNPPASRTVIIDTATVWRNGPTTLDTAAPLHIGDTIGLAALAASDGIEHAVVVDIGATTPTNPDASIKLPGPTLAPGPTSKALATITAATDTSITVTVHGGDDDGKTATADTTSTPFYTNDGTCRPTDLAVGTEVGIAFHLDETSGVVADAILLIA